MTIHNPTPWTFHRQGPDESIYIIDQPTGHFVARMELDDSGTYEEADAKRKANAEFIVRAVNTYPDLMEALKRCQVRLFMAEGNSEEYDLASAVIANAEGR